MKYPGGFAVFYYLNHKGQKFGSVKVYKTWMMSKKFSTGKYYICGIAEFDGELMNSEWL